MVPFLFFAFSIVAVVAALTMVIHRNPLYSALFLIVSLFALAGLFVLLAAPFIAAVQVIVYAGAIMVLFLFVIMLLDLRAEARTGLNFRPWHVVAVFLALALLAEFGLMLKSGVTEVRLVSVAPALVGSTRAVGEVLFTRYLFAFEVASVLLLAAIIGAVVLAKRKLR